VGRPTALSWLWEHAPGLSASFCAVVSNGNLLIACTVCGTPIVKRKVREGRCGVYGVVRAGGRGHERPWCRFSAVVGQNRALGALLETASLSFRTGGRVGTKCAAVLVIASVPPVPARGAWGRQRPPLAALLPQLPRTRLWALDDPVHDARPHAAAGGGRGRGGGDSGGSRGGGGGCREPRVGGARAPFLWRHVHLPPKDTQPPLPRGRRSRRRPRWGGRLGGPARAATRSLDGSAGPEPPRPAAGRAIAVTAVSNRPSRDGDSRCHGRVTTAPLRRVRSWATALVAAGRRTPAPPPAVGRHRAAHGGAAADLGLPAGRRGAWPALGHAWPCPAAAGGRRPRQRPPRVDAVHVCTWGEVFVGRPNCRRRRNVGTPPRRHPCLRFREAVSWASGLSLVNTKDYSHSKCSEPWHTPDSGVKQVLTLRIARPAFEWLRALSVPRFLTASLKCLDGGAAQTRSGLTAIVQWRGTWRHLMSRRPDKASPLFFIPHWKRPHQTPHQQFNIVRRHEAILDGVEDCIPAPPRLPRANAAGGGSG